MSDLIIEIPSEANVGDMVRIFKAILMWQGFAMRTADEIFAEELRELKEEKDE